MEASKATRRSKEALAKTLIAGEPKLTAFSALYGVSRDGEKAVLDGVTTHWIGLN